jgi:hypothetical protein
MGLLCKYKAGHELWHSNTIGANKSIKSLLELDKYEGGTFVSGSAYFPHSKEVKRLVKRKKQIRYDIVDDVSVGLMFSKHEVLSLFSLPVFPDTPVSDIISMIRQRVASHIRPEPFP